MKKGILEYIYIFVIISFLFTLLLFFRILLLKQHEYSFRSIAIHYAWNMKDREYEDTKRIVIMFYKPEIWNIFKWKKEDFIINKEFYQKVLDVYQLEILKEQVENEKNDKTFMERVKNIEEDTFNILELLEEI
jgi:hypothetical protein